MIGGLNKKYTVTLSYSAYLPPENILTFTIEAIREEKQKVSSPFQIEQKKKPNHVTLTCDELAQCIKRGYCVRGALLEAANENNITIDSKGKPKYNTEKAFIRQGAILLDFDNKTDPPKPELATADGVRDMINSKIGANVVSVVSESWTSSEKLRKWHVVLLLSKPCGELEKVKAVIHYLVDDKFEGLADTSCKDCARYVLGSTPEKITKSYGGELDIEPIYQEVLEKMAKEEANKAKTSQTDTSTDTDNWLESVMQPEQLAKIILNCHCSFNSYDDFRNAATALFHIAGIPSSVIAQWAAGYDGTEQDPRTWEDMNKSGKFTIRTLMSAAKKLDLTAYNAYKQEIYNRYKPNKHENDVLSRELQAQIEQTARETDTEKRAQQFTEVVNTARTQGLEQQALQLAEGICRKENLPELWELPRPFDGGAALPKLTERCLPPKLWEYLQAVSEYVQVAPEMAVFPLLSVLSTCVQGKAVITYPKSDHTEPLNIYAMTIAAPGERKSGCFKEFVMPLHEYQYTYNLSHKFDIQKYITEKEFLKRQKENSMKGQKADRKKALEITKQLSELEEVHELKLIVEDTTPEALAAELAKQGERVAILDDEGSVFDVISGAYSNTQVNINIFLKGYDGAPYTVTRKMSPDIMLLNPLLVMGLMVQPSHFTEAMCNKQFSGRGFIHRFMFAFPEPMSGHLKFESPNISPNLRTAYSDIVKSLLTIPYPKEKSPVIRHSHESELLFENYFDHLQFEMKQGGQFENMKEWASKQFARALRIAGIFHMIEHCKDTKPTAEPLSGESAFAALELCRWSEQQAVHALSGEGAESETVQNAKMILDKLKGLEVNEITKGELLAMKINRLTSQEITEPLELLADLNYIKIVEVKNGQRGKPKVIIQINPNIKNDFTEFTGIS